MMGADDRHHGTRELHALQNLGANNGVDLHLLEFFRRQFSGLGDDVLRYGQLANVM